MDADSELQVLHRAAGKGGVHAPRCLASDLSMELSGGAKHEEYGELLCEFTLFVVIGIYDPAKHVLRFAGSADEAIHDAEQ